jgi:4,5-dihydroxyphthalate decarboxylase
MTTRLLNRRDLLKAAGLIAAGGALGIPGLRQTHASPADKLKITIAGYDFDRVAALSDGRVSVQGFTLDFEKDSIGAMNTHVFSGPRTRDVTEIGLHPFMLAYANEGFRDYALLPVFPLRIFRHKSIFIRTDRGISKPEDLKGKKVATPGFSSTSLTWLRGILQHQHGVKPGDVEWFVSAKDSSAALSGGASKLERVIPEGLNVKSGPVGKDESDMLADGDVDALLHAAEPKCFVEGHPKVSRLFPDFRAAEQAYYKKTGIFPIMHAVAVRKKTIEAHPTLPGALFKAYSQAKLIAYKELNAKAWAYNSLPWLAQELEDTRNLMGDNFWPYGIKPNRKALETLFSYSHEQGLASQELKIEDLFHPSTLELIEQ